MTATRTSEEGLPTTERVHDVAVDGRTARGARTRAAVVDALLALQEEGDLRPTASRVAERAGVALRTVYGHFSDLESLWAEAGQRELLRLRALRDHVPPDLPLRERIARFAASRARVLEALLPVMRAARLREPGSPTLLRNRATFIASGDEEVRTVFARELAARTPGQQDRLLDAVYSVAAGPAWEVLRHDRGRDVDEAREAVRRALTALLDPDAYREDPL